MRMQLIGGLMISSSAPPRDRMASRESVALLPSIGWQYLVGSWQALLMNKQRNPGFGIILYLLCKVEFGIAHSHADADTLELIGNLLK